MRRRLFLLRREFRDRFTKFLSKLPKRIAHLFFFAGIISIVAGCALIYRPAGFIAGGLFAVWISFLIAAEASKQ